MLLLQYFRQEKHVINFDITQGLIFCDLLPIFSITPVTLICIYISNSLLSSAQLLCPLILLLLPQYHHLTTDFSHPRISDKFCSLHCPWPHSVTNPLICPPAKLTGELKTIIFNEGKRQKTAEKKRAWKVISAFSFAVSLRRWFLTSAVASPPIAYKREEPHSTLL